MGATIGRRKARTEYGIIEGRGNLADTAADLLHDLTVIIRAGCTIALRLGTLTDRLIKGELLARLKYGAIDGSSSQLYVLITGRIARGLRREAADRTIEVLDRGVGCGDLLTLGLDRRVIDMLFDGRHHLLCSRLCIDRITCDRATENELAALLIVARDVAVLRAHLPDDGELLHVVRNLRTHIRKFQCIAEGCTRRALALTLRFRSVRALLCFARRLTVGRRRCRFFRDLRRIVREDLLDQRIHLLADEIRDGEALRLRADRYAGVRIIDGHRLHGAIIVTLSGRTARLGFLHLIIDRKIRHLEAVDGRVRVLHHEVPAVGIMNGLLHRLAVHTVEIQALRLR